MVGKSRLTDTQCFGAKPKDKAYKLVDGDGLYLEIKTNGVKAWRYRFKLPKDGLLKESTFAIGNYVRAPAGEGTEEAKARRAAGLFTLAEAREERVKARGLVKQGQNPALHRQLQIARKNQLNAITFESVAMEWLKLKGWEESTKKHRISMLQRVVFPKIGSLPVHEIKAPHIWDVLKAAHDANGPTTANDAKRAMYGIFDLAISTARAENNPVAPVSKLLPKNKTQHKTALTPEEICLLFKDVKKHGGRYETNDAFRLLWWTLCRPNEVVEAEWSEFDLDNAVWKIPPSRMKKRKEHVVPLPRQAVDALVFRKNLTGHYKHVFPGRDDRTKPMSSASLRQMLKSIGWAGKFSPHATRTTGSTRLNEMGYAADWIERQLSHVESKSSRKSYNHAEYWEQRKNMMQEWANFLEKIEI